LTTEDDRVFVALAGDWRVFSFIALLAAGTCLIFGVMPAVRATATSPGAAMKAGSRGMSDSRERFGLRRMLVVAQVALSLVLLVGALLFAGSLRNIVTINAGFKHDAILVATIDFRRAGLADANITLTHAQLLERLRRQPQALEQLRMRQCDIGVGQARPPEVDGGNQNRVVLEAGIDRDDVAQAAREQKRTHQQHQRQGDLSDDEHAAKAEPLAGIAHAAAAGFHSSARTGR